MPDQSTAAEEHALISEISQPLDELFEEDLPAEGEVDFPVVLRGYDRFAVDAYVKQMARRIADLQADHEPDAAVRRALERVGEDVSGILQRAHETAARITTNSRREAEERLERARQEAAELTAAAQRRLAELDADADRIWSERARIIDDARDLAVQLSSLADSAAERFPPAPPEEEVETAEIESTRRAGAMPFPVAADPEADATGEPDATREPDATSEPDATGEPDEVCEPLLHGDPGPVGDEPAPGERDERPTESWQPPATAEWPASGRGAWSEVAGENGAGHGGSPHAP